MVVSTAFEELTEVLKCLESSDVEIRNVALREQTPENEDQITADLTVSVPVFRGVTLQDGVSIEAENIDLENDQIDVDLSVKLPVKSDATGNSGQESWSASNVGLANSLSQSTSVPSYKDPEALRTVYEEYDTFPEMTEALGADVTSETVRRYMVEYDIHDPSDNTPQSHGYRNSSQQDTAETTTATSVTSSPTDSQPQKSESESHDTDEQTTAQTTDSAPTADSEESVDESESNTGSSNSENSGTETTEPADSALGRESVAEMIAETDNRESDDSLVADGFGIPRDLTVAELANIVNESNTIHEVKQRLDMSQSNARRLLQELNLIDFVTHRLAADQIDISYAEIQRRIDPESH